MSQFNNITEFNTNLSNKLIKYDLSIYFNTIHSKFYKNVDISFMDYFLSLIHKKNEFCVDHNKLQEYGVLNNIDTSRVIKDCLAKFNLIENEDYLVENVLLQLPSGTKYSKEYKLTPYAFKLCLIRAKNSKKYANYYLMLEEIFYYYREYQNQFQQVIINNISKENKTLNEKIEELLHYAKETKEQNEELYNKVEELNDNVEDLKEQNEDIKDTMEDIKDAFKNTADRSVPDPKNENERHEFILLQHRELLNNFKFMRGIQKLNDLKIQKKYSEYNIIKREYNANPIQLYKMFKDTMKDKYKIEKKKISENKNLKNKTQLKKEVDKIKFTGNDFELQYNYKLNDLLDDLTKVCNEKFNDYNEYKEDP